MSIFLESLKNQDCFISAVRSSYTKNSDMGIIPITKIEINGNLISSEQIKDLINELNIYYTHEHYELNVIFTNKH